MTSGAVPFSIEMLTFPLYFDIHGREIGHLSRHYRKWVRNQYMRGEHLYKKQPEAILFIDSPGIKLFYIM